MTELVSLPKCPECGEAMIPSMCIAYKEYVCIPCGYSVEFCNSLNKIEITEKELDRMRSKYEKDINKLAFTNGGASCGTCNKKGGNNCKKCNIDYDFEYWRID